MDMLFEEDHRLTEKCIYERIRDLLRQNRELPVEVAIKELKAYSSVSFYETDALRIQCGKSNTYLWFAQLFKKLLLGYPKLTISTPSSEKLWTRVSIKSIDEINNFQLLFLEIYDEACLLGASDPFGCCSRYMECSDQKKCIHPSLKLSRDCQYRKHLLNGRIFYGINRTIGDSHLS